MGVLSGRVGTAFFRYGFAAGALAGLWPALLMFLFFDAYLANSPV